MVQSWGVKVTERQKLNLFEMKCLRSMTGVSRLDRVTCGYLWMVLGTSPKVTMDGRLYNQLCLLFSPTKLVGGLLTGPYAEDC